MKTIPKLVLAVSLVGASVIGGGLLTACSSVHQQESTGQYVDSSVITAKVKAKLLADDQVNGLQINVKTYKNTVQLSGFVNNNFQSGRAELLASQVEGVGNVKNDLIVKRH